MGDAAEDRDQFALPTSIGLRKNRRKLGSRRGHSYAKRLRCFIQAAPLRDDLRQTCLGGGEIKVFTQ